VKTSRLSGVACALGIVVTACSSNDALTGVTIGSADQSQEVMHNGIGPSGVPANISTVRGWMSPDAKKSEELLYVSVQGLLNSFVDIFSVPQYSMVGQITDGIYDPEGLATDKKGNLYVSNLVGAYITVYKPGTASPSLTLRQTWSPLDVAVGDNGYVYAGDIGGGIDVYPPGATSPIRRLTNAALANRVTGVAVSVSNSLYATGFSGYYSGPAVVKFANARGSGTNLSLKGLKSPVGVIIDNNNGPRHRPHVIVTDYGLSEILLYRPGQKSPARIIMAPFPDRSTINKSENLIYVPEGKYGTYGVGVYDYPGGALVTTIPIGGYHLGAALGRAPAP
jgi:hypothetical protein